MDQLEVLHALVEVPETGRLYQSVKGFYCRIIDLATNDEDGALYVVYRPFRMKRSFMMKLAQFVEPVRWDDGRWRQRFMPSPHLPRELQAAE